MSFAGDRVSIRLTGQLLSLLGLKHSDRVTILLGEGPDVGAMQIFAGNGYAIRRVNKTQATGHLAVQPWKHVDQKPHPSRAVEHRLGRTSEGKPLLLITLPEWAAPRFHDVAPRRSPPPPIPLLK
ncbi:MAG TPA: hypothetical protein VGV37_13340 [Aliidongia sp.]|uniref:hypothetical protein n=1 Tax=Aliidongia sp. TaxID=1914230 RepID=UPI002DDC9048|nr:hypothetical protein [Aliidongia sp.]HEV2675522.1 hypothetical protein [Aliidongia sp.]